MQQSCGDCLHAGQSSAQSAGQGMRHATGQGQNRMQEPNGMSRGPGQVTRQPQGQGIPSSSHTMSSSGPSTALTPGRGPASPGGLPSLSPMGPGSLLSPTSGLGNLFNEEVASTSSHADWSSQNGPSQPPCSQPSCISQVSYLCFLSDVIRG